MTWFILFELFHIAAAIPAMCTQVAFRESDGGHKVFKTLELERCELEMSPGIRIDSKSKQRTEKYTVMEKSTTFLLI